MTAAILRFEAASKTYRVNPMFGRAKAVQAMREVSFSLDAGRALAVVGESGSGKSTCGRAAARLFPLSAGRILFRGRDIATIRTRADRLAYRRAVQMVFQDPFAALNPTHTIRHHLERPLRLMHRVRGRALEQRLQAILADVELDPDTTVGKYPHQLSGGQRQRVNLARALAVGAELIIADEPTSMLDVSIRRSVLDLMRRLKDAHGLAILYITHDIATARYLAEETAVMFAGRIVEWGPSAAVIGAPQHPYARLLLSAVPDPAVRFSADPGSGRDFSAHAETVRRLADAPHGPPVAASPGHFVRHALPARAEAEGAMP